MAERGEVRGVAWVAQGSELSSAVSIGGLSLTVDNPVDFDEDGGTLDLNGVQLDYATIDQDTGIITLDVALVAAAAIGDKVKIVSGGSVAIDYVAFVSLGDGDEVEVPIPYAQRDMWPEGEYDYPVVVDLANDLEAIIAVPGRTPIRDGSFIDPSTLPAPVIPTSDGNPPAFAPANLVVVGGVGALFVRWTPISNRDPVTYDLHVSPTTGFTPSAATLAVSSMASSYTLRQLPTGVGTPPNQALSYDALYYFKVIPRDADGTGPTSAEASGQMVRVTGPDVAAQSITGDRIVGGTITGDLFSSSVVLGSKISTGGLDDNGNLTGARVDLSPDGLTTYAPDGVTAIVNFPLDPLDDAFIHNAHLSMLSADVADNLTVYGKNNELAASATLQLGAGITSPSTPPSLTSAYDTVQLDTTTLVPSAGGSNQDFNLGTFKLDPSQITSIVWDTVYFCWQVLQQKSTGFRLWRFGPTGALFNNAFTGTPWIDDYRGMSLASVCRNGWIQQWTDGKWYAWETITGGGRWGVIPNSWLLGGPGNPFMAFDEVAQLSMLVQNDTYANDTVQVRRFHTVPYVGGAIQNAVSDSVVTSPVAVQRQGNIAGAYYGSADFGGPRYATASAAYTKVNVWVPGTRYNGAANYQEWDCQALPLGLGWDGSNFWSVDATGRMTKYTNWTWPAEPSTTWVGMSAYDSNATGGTHETPVGTMANRNAARRSKLTVTAPATRTSPANTDDPDKWRVYYARVAGAAVPTASLLKLAATIGDPTLPTSATLVADPTGINPPGGIYGQAGAVNTFPAGNPAQLLDGTGNVLADAQGHGVLGLAGEVRMYGGAAAPAGWLLCDGSSLVRTAYPALFAIIGITFGKGSDSPVGTTFNLPDMRSRFPAGAGLYAALGSSEAGVPGVIAGTPPAESVARPDRMGHSHDHGNTGQTGSSHTHGIPGQAAGTSVSAGTASGFAPTNAAYSGHSHGGDTTSSGSGHTHNTVAASALASGTVHAFTAFNFIIRT
jgi:microcystin-dependent protein